MAQKKTDSTEKFEKQDLNLFEVLAALDKKDYGYYGRLTEEQKKKFVPFMMLHWMSAIKGNEGLSRYYVMSTAEYGNKYMFNENVQKHPELQWMMLCASSPGLGKQFHQWIPHIKERVAKLKEVPKKKDIQEYFKKIYSGASKEDLSLLSDVFIEGQKKKMYLAEKFPNLKYDEIEVLSELVSDDEIKQYEEDYGN